MKHPDVDVRGENYPPKPVYAAVAKFVGVLWILGMAFAVLNEKLFSLLGVRNLMGEELIRKVVENKMMVLVGLFMLNNMSQNLIATGAFEVYFDGEIVHSKLDTGAVPTVEQILGAVDALRGVSSAAIGSAADAAAAAAISSL
jgi:selT/selW/selH-like putative selenoprotein